jgi:hypothetical protein
VLTVAALSMGIRFREAAPERSGLLHGKFAERVAAGRFLKPSENEQGQTNELIRPIWRPPLASRTPRYIDTALRAITRNISARFHAPFECGLEQGLVVSIRRGSDNGNETCKSPAAALMRSTSVRRCMTPVQVGHRPLRLPRFGPSCRTRPHRTPAASAPCRARRTAGPVHRGAYGSLRRFKKSIRCTPRMIAGKQPTTRLQAVPEPVANGAGRRADHLGCLPHVIGAQPFDPSHRVSLIRHRLRPRRSIRSRISSTRQAVVLPPSLTGFGKQPSLTPCHHVDLPTGIGPVGAIHEACVGKGRIVRHGIAPSNCRLSETITSDLELGRMHVNANRMRLSKSF